MFENFTPKQGNSLKILAAGTRNHGVSLPPRDRKQTMLKIGMKYSGLPITFPRMSLLGKENGELQRCLYRKRSALRYKLMHYLSKCMAI